MGMNILPLLLAASCLECLAYGAQAFLPSNFLRRAGSAHPLRAGGSIPFSSRLRGGGVRMKARQPTSEELYFPSSYLDGTGQQRGYCNWILPGKVMLGRYPAGTPVGTKTGSPTPSETLDHMRKVMAAGVDTFICLQLEVPPQEADAEWPGDGIIQLADLQMREKYPGGFVRYQQDALQISKELGRSSPPTFVRLPILDFSTPELGALSNLLNQAASAITDQGSVIYVHCWGGRGRAGTIGACMYLLLGQFDNLSPQDAAEEALEVVQRGYDTRVGEDGGGNKSPETEGQRDFVRAFATSLRKTSMKGG